MTKEYRGYKIEGDGTYGYMHIKQIKGGKVPSPLDGAWTSVPHAERAIDTFLNNKGVTNEAVVSA